MARKIHTAVLRHIHQPPGMSLPSFRSLTIKLDPTTGTLVEVSAEPHETPALLTALDRIQHVQRVLREEARQGALSGNQPPQAPDQTVGAAPGKPEPAERPSKLLSEAIEQWIRVQMDSGQWSEQTRDYTHAPSLRMFRELVGERLDANACEPRATPTFDLDMGEVTPARIENFLEDFWRFPDRQGRRAGAADAKSQLAAGGKAQSRANVFKRLGHIRQFIAYSVSKRWVEQQVLVEIDNVLAKDTARSREKDALKRASSTLELADGYVAFTGSDLSALFGEAFARHVRGNIVRYWIPLIGLHSGMRIAEISQLRPSHFVVVDGIPCVEIRPDLGPVEQESEDEVGRVKNLPSVRVVPLHPRLVELGLLDLVERRRKQGKTRMWDGLPWHPKSGFGRYPSRDFQLLSQTAKVYVKRRKVFHSFRSTLSQALERAGLESELIDRLIGHEVHTTRMRNYNRTEEGPAFPVRRVHDLLSRVSFPVEVGRWPLTAPASPAQDLESRAAGTASGPQSQRAD